MLTANYDISVVVPIYNVEDYIRPCLDSLLRQGPVSIQVIMIDDGSTDSSGHIADEYASHYSNFSCYHIPNGGQGNARNIGTGYAGGKYLMFADSDDIVPDNTYIKLFRIAERDGSDLTICNVARFNSSKIYKSKLHEKVFNGLGCKATLETDHSLLYDTCSYNKLIRRSFFVQNKFAFPTGYYYEDIPFSTHMYLAAKSVSVLHEIGYLWREREGDIRSVTQKTSDINNLRDRLTAIEETDRILSSCSASEELLRSWRKKLLTTDFMVFCNLCTRLKDDLLFSMIDLISDYISKHMQDSDYTHLDPVLQKKYEAIRARDIELLREVRRYERSRAYKEMEICEENGNLRACLSEKLFGNQPIDMSETIRPLRAEINDLKLSSKELSIEANFYRSRPYIRTDMESIKIFLYNEFSRKSIPLETTVLGNGLVRAVLDTDIANAIPVSEDPFWLVYKCKGKFFDDAGLLRFRGTMKKGITFPTVVHDDRYVCIEESLLRHPAFYCRDNSLFLKGVTARFNALRIDLHTPRVPVRFESENDGSINSSSAGFLHRYEAIRPAKMAEGIEYNAVAIVDPESRYMCTSHIISQKKEVSILDTKAGFVVLNTLKTGVPRLTRHSVISLATSMTPADTRFQITAVTKSIHGISKYVRAYLTAVSRDGESEYVLASSTGISQYGGAVFDVDPEALGRFAKADEYSHIIKIRLHQADGTTVSTPLYSTTKYSSTFDTSSGPVKIFRSIHGYLSLIAP